MTTLTLLVGKFMPIVVLSLVGYSYYVFVYRICIGPLIRENHQITQAVVYLVIFNILFFMVIISYFRILFRSPGSPLEPPKQKQKNNNNNNNNNNYNNNYNNNNNNRENINIKPTLKSSTIVSPTQQISSFTIHNFNPISNPNNSSNVGALDALLPMEVASIKNPPTAITTTTINIASSSSNETTMMQQNGTSTNIRIPMPSTFICKRDGRLRWCERCNYVKPDRCHHCSECDKCVLKMDHHCPWVNGCVGYYNYKFFYLFIIYTSIYADFIFFSTIPFVVDQLRDLNKDLDVQWITLLILGFIFGLLLTGFTIVHTIYILQNKTTIEGISSRSRTNHVRIQFDSENSLNYGIATTREGENLWNLGWKQNWKTIMGSKWWLWFVPIGDPPGDGMIYPYDPIIHNRLIEDAKIQSQPQDDNRTTSMIQQSGGGNSNQN
ncbi:hypothetical protein Glove_26g100 [Diversispora epigaea]|uniref:Palmitoyltransferase n=1 Tax=Diversispora epigaea TaxID=1348612 RepID=A0A397JK77_9GLOM|nr:hypothetical protein Glove_26g100 [Diversispora epigaea]